LTLDDTFYRDFANNLTFKPLRSSNPTFSPRILPLYFKSRFNWTNRVDKPEVTGLISSWIGEIFLLALTNWIEIWSDNFFALQNLF